MSYAASGYNLARGKRKVKLSDLNKTGTKIYAGIAAIFILLVASGVISMYL